jgi:toxin FitB
LNAGSTATLTDWFGNHLLPVIKPISHRWGTLDALSQQRGKPLGNIDGLLAATALERDLTVVTRNTKHFAGTGVAILNPWEADLSG